VVAVSLAFDEQLAHQIEAGSDMFLMPSRYEPCGLNQMYSMKYGTIPVVRATGGLADTVLDHAEGRESTGFLFTEYSAGALFGVLERARKVFDDKEAWAGMIDRAMAQDFSWDRSAATYTDVYLETLARGGGEA
jgi:starch synthase